MNILNFHDLDCISHIFEIRSNIIYLAYKFRSHVLRKIMQPLKSFVPLSFLIMFAPLIIQAAETYVRDTSPPFVASDEAVYRTPTIVVSSKGTILAFAGKRDSHEDDSLIAVALRRSTDGGKTWLEEQIIAIGEETNSIACPVVIPASDAFDKERIFVLFLKNDLVDKRARNGGRALYRIVSKDDGQNWNKEKQITFQNANNNLTIDINANFKNSSGEDPSKVLIRSPHKWVWYGIGPGHGVYLSSQQEPKINGRIVFAARFTWDPQGIQDSCTQSDFIDNKEGIGDCSDKDRQTRTHLIYSDPDSKGRYKQWFMGAVADEKSSEAALAEKSNGEIIVTARRTGSKRWVFTSIDGGIQFSGKYQGPLDPGGCQASLISAGEDKEHIFISNPNSGALENQEDRINGSLQIKNGSEWIPKVRYSDKKYAFSGYSDLAVLTDKNNEGDIGVLFERGGYEIRECNNQKYSRIENRNLAIPFSSKKLGGKKQGRWHMIDFKVIPKELILENHHKNLKTRFESPRRGNISETLQREFKMPKNCKKIWSAKPPKSSTKKLESQSLGRRFSR